MYHISHSRTIARVTILGKHSNRSLAGRRFAFYYRVNVHYKLTIIDLGTYVYPNSYM